MIKSLVRPVAVTVCLTVIICWLFAKSRQTGHDEYDRFSQLLTMISRLDAEINAEVLKLEFELHKSYDRLTHFEQNFMDCTGELEEHRNLAFNNDEENRARLMQPILRKRELVADFKSRHAVLENSVAIFYGTSEKLSQHLLLTDVTADIRSELLQLQKAGMELVLNAGEPNRMKLQQRLERMTNWSFDPASQAQRFCQVLRAHGQNLLKARPMMDLLLRELSELDVPNSLQAMHDNATGVFAVASKRAAGYQIQMLCAALLLIGYCGYSIFSIGKYVRTIRLANEELEQRVWLRTKELEAKSEALRSNGKFLASVLDAMDAKICILDANGKINATNAVWDAHSDDPAWLKAGEDYLQAFAASDRTSFGATDVVEAVEGMMASDENTAIVEYETTGSGNTQWVQARINKMPSGRGSYLGFVVALIDITQRVAAELEKDKLHRQLQSLSRQAGMAEVATGVLHNVGNVLNSINIASGQATRIVRTSRLASLQKAEELVEQHLDDFATFVSEDPRGQQIPRYIMQIAKTWESEQALMLAELDELNKHIDHVKHVINVQQENAKLSTVTQKVQLKTLMEDAITTILPALKAEKIELVREFQVLPDLDSDPHKIMQILINLLSNAKHAVQDSATSSPTIVFGARVTDQVLNIYVTDNGIGIAPENLARLCQHGFTTKKNGHGFGLHSCALLAKELGGSLEFTSPGVDKGATFMLVLPKSQAELTADKEFRHANC